MDSLKLKRGSQVLAPSLFTMGNMACGFLSLIAANAGDFATAALSILGGIVFDMLDGRVARLVHGESSFGVEFDSLSDFLSFGIAPAYMMYALILKDLGVTGGVCAFIFALCGGLRLARFNVVAQGGAGSKSHFQGLPIPAGAGFLASFVLLYVMVEQPRPSRTVGLVMEGVPYLVAASPLLMVALGALMVSTIPYAAFKQAGMFQRPNAWRFVVAAAGLLLVYLFPQNAIFLLASAYVLSGVAGLFFTRKGAADARPAGDRF